jgi:hypothetical protein
VLKLPQSEPAAVCQDERLRKAVLRDLAAIAVRNQVRRPLFLHISLIFFLYSHVHILSDLERAATGIRGAQGGSPVCGEVQRGQGTRHSHQ